jgi:hypothetical protein
MQPAWHTQPVPPTDGKAIAALVLGILSLVGTMCWLGAPLGIPAIILGTLAIRDVRRSDGMTGGIGMATAGVVMGSLGSLLFACWVGFMIFTVAKAGSVTVPGPSPMPPTAPPTAATPPPLVPPGGWGHIHVVVVHPSSSQTLRAQLADEVRAGKTAGETVLVETIAPSCPACVEIAREMPDPALQVVLANVRLVHVDVAEFDVEASALHLSTPGLPWFYLVDTRGDPRDGIGADEWDDNDAAEIAPVLEAFLKGTLHARRQVWRGGTSL